jgi:hypothetical protein
MRFPATGTSGAVRGRPGRLAPNPLRSLHDQPEPSFLICLGRPVEQQVIERFIECGDPHQG